MASNSERRSPAVDTMAAFRSLSVVNGDVDAWVPACGGSEVPFLFNGVRWMYVYNPHRHEHAYLNLDTDTLHDSFGGAG